MKNQIQILLYIRIVYNLLFMENFIQPNIFFQEKQSSTHQDNCGRQDECPESIPYLKRGDSNLYLDQFLVKPSQQILPTQQREDSKNNEHYSGSGDEQFQPSEVNRFNPSAFHNFQKHLTVCLKHSIEIISEQKSLRDYQIVGAKMWRIFKNSSVSTKKILHYLLGEKNQHKITQQGLKQYGLTKIYQIHGERLMTEARIYLARQTLRQIKEGKLEDYITMKKLKDKDKFKKYVEIFVEELQRGYLRKRLPKDKVAYLLRC